MKNALRLIVVGAIALLISSVGFAQTPESSTLPVTEPLEVGGTILQPGTYVIRVLPSSTDRNKVQITSTDFKTVFATVLTVPHPLEPNEEIPNTTYIFYPAGEGMPRALRTWFAPNPPTFTGHDIVYEESRAKQLPTGQIKVVFYQRNDGGAGHHDVAGRASGGTVETYTCRATTPVVTPMSSASETQVESGHRDSVP